jgi:hypothetical protein
MVGCRHDEAARPTTPEEEGIELRSDAWERFERTVDMVAKAPPVHRTAKPVAANRARKADNLGVPINLRPSPGTTVPPRVADPPRSAAVPARTPGPPQQPTEQSVGSHGHEVDRRTLIIGEGISLSGEVTSCDRLIVESTIEAKLEKCQHVIIAETGVFNGNASTENADVRGLFQGRTRGSQAAADPCRWSRFRHDHLWRDRDRIWRENIRRNRRGWNGQCHSQSTANQSVSRNGHRLFAARGCSGVHEPRLRGHRACPDGVPRRIVARVARGRARWRQGGHHRDRRQATWPQDSRKQSPSEDRPRPRHFTPLLGR